MDDGSPTLEVGFAITPEFGELQALQTLMNSTEMKVVAEAAKIERATSGMVNLAGSTASITSFGNAVSRTFPSAAATMTRTEKAAELLAAKLTRQAETFGMTSAAATAYRANMAGATDAATELLAAETALKALKTEAKLAAEATAARERAAAEAAVNVQLLERARLDAALERSTGLGRMRATDAGATFSALAARERELELAEKESAAEHQLAAEMRAQNAVLAERASIQAALERTTGVGRASAMDAGASFSALAARAAEEEARSATVAAAAQKRLADEHERLAATVQGSQAAQEADAAAAERLRAATDPLYAATKRLNAEIAESERLYRTGATLQPEYTRQQEVLTGRIRALGAANEESATKVGRNNFALKQTAIQIPDIISGLATGQKPMQIFFQQGGQIAQIAQMAEGGLKGFAVSIGEVALRFTPLIAATAVAGVALYRWKEQINDDAGLKKFADGLGLTSKEMKKLGDVSVTTGDLVAGVWKTITDATGAGGSGKKLLDYLFSPNDAREAQTFVSQIYGVFVGGYNAIVELWSEIAPAVSGFVSRAAAAAATFFEPLIDAANWAGSGIAHIFSGIYDWVADRVRVMAQWVAPILQAIGLDKAASAMSSAGSKLGSTFGAAYAKATQQFVTGTNAAVATAAENAAAHARDRLTKKASEIKEARTPKVDHHAEELAREAEAIEAQIRNLYKLADAYSVSGAAALIAEARVKAESAAIKQRGDIEASVDRQVRLAIAQRVADADKSAAGMRAQADAQEQVNALVAAGLVPAARAAEMVKEQIADLPLLDAIQAAQQRGLAMEAARATKALDDQRTARERNNEAARQAAFASTMQSAADELDRLQQEARLIGATTEARVHDMAVLKAWQDAQRQGMPIDQALAYVAAQVKIADQTEANRVAQEAYNGSLTFTADKWDIIASKVQSAASGMADAFGNAGKAVGDLASIYAAFNASRERATEEHDKAIKAAGSSEVLIAQENAKFALRSTGAQIEAFGDMAAAAKGFFHEGSAGYKAMAAAEKVYRVAQLAMSLQAMVQMALETTAHVAGSAAQATADGAAGVAKQSQLPFPANIAAMAATAAALVAAGVAVFGGRGGGSSAADYTKSNTGTGTVLGDPDAKSASIKNAIDLLKSVDDATLTVSRSMLASLRAIETNIGGLASLLVRTGNLDASAGVKQGFSTDSLGKALSYVATGGVLGVVLKKIPVIGDILGGVGKVIQSLFGSKTTVVGSGLYGGSQSLGDILSGGYDLQTYSDIQKKKKFFGVTTGTSYSTQYGQADTTIDDQFTLVLRSFYTAIGKAAPELGQATSDVEKRLDSFVFSLGKIDIAGKSGAEIQELLENALGAAADQMAATAFPGFERFQKVGEGLFETITRVASTVEQVDAVFNRLGVTTTSLGIDVDMAVANMFDSVGDFTSLADTYFSDFYTKQEQAAANTAQLTKALGSMGLALPDTLAAYRQLAEAQDLTTDAGRATYVTLLQLAPAFSDLKTSLEGAKSAADILSEREDLNTKLLQLTGDTAALRAAELAKLDPSNRALQSQIYAIQDAQDAAKAADTLRQAWSSVGDSIETEIRRIRGLTDASSGGSFASLLGQFNAATASARAGDQDAAKLLPGLSQSLLTQAAAQATSRQELDRVQAQTAASLEATYGVITALTGAGKAGTTSLLDAAATASQASTTTAANDGTAAAVADLKSELADMSTKLTAALATIAGNTGRTAKKLDDFSESSGGDAVRVAA